ncbi:MAG: hypothetical protein ACSLE8_06165 [Rhodococcus sp. (in: high G+C Gram-positive bacteria)]
MRTHTITITVSAPNHLSAEDVRDMVKRLVDIGVEDAQDTLDDDPDSVDAKDAVSLKFKSIGVPL